MTPTELRAIQLSAVCSGVISGGACLISLYMNKFTNISKLPYGLPVDIIAEVGVVARIYNFVATTSVILTREKFSNP